MTQPVFYLRALSITDDSFATVTAAKLKDAYTAAAKIGHPDHGGDAELWSIITSAYNEAKSIITKKRGATLNKTDEMWLKRFTEYAAKTEQPKAADDEWKFEDIEGESKDDRRKRYARTRQQWRYARDPEYAKARKEASLKSHAKKAARDKAAKAAAKKNQPAAA